MDFSDGQVWTLEKIEPYSHSWWATGETAQKRMNDLVMMSIVSIDTSKCPSHTVRNLDKSKQISESCVLSIRMFIKLLLLCTSKTNGFYTTGIRSHVWLFRYIGITTDLWTIEFFDSVKKYEDNMKESRRLKCTCPAKSFCYVKHKENDYNYFKMSDCIIRTINGNIPKSDKICYSCKTSTCPDKISDRDKNRKIHFYAKLITGQDRCVRATLLIICILRFRRNEFIFQGLIDYNTVKMIGKYIYQTKDEEVWKR